MRAVVFLLGLVVALGEPTAARSEQPSSSIRSPSSVCGNLNRLATADHIRFVDAVERSLHAVVTPRTGNPTAHRYLGLSGATQRDQADGEQNAFRRKAVLGVFVGAAILAGVAVKYNFDADAAFRDAETAHRSYEEALITEDAVYWRSEMARANRRGNDAASTRNVLYLSGAALYFVGLMAMMLSP